MVIIPSLLMAGLIVGLGRKWIRAHAGIAYLLTLAISAAIVAGVWSGAVNDAPFWMRDLLPIFTQDGLAGALFMVVMFASAVPNGSAFMKTVMPVRGELSIIASILTLGHNIAFGRTYFARLFTGEAMPLPTLGATICSILMLAIMLPLFVTSFKRIRRVMKPKSWKRLQRFAYAFYGLMYLHILLLNFPGALMGSVTARINVVAYSAIFLSYGCLRIRKALMKRQPLLAKQLPICAVVLMACVCCGLLLPIADSDAASALIDGIYSGSGIGYNGRMTVSLTIESGTIVDAHMTSYVDDEPYITDAMGGILPAVLESQSAQVDAVSGATTSSLGILDAVRSALHEAQGDK